MRCSAAQFPQQIPSYPWLVTSLLSLLLPVFVASFPVLSAILLRCDFPFVAPSFCFSRLFRFCCPVAFFLIASPRCVCSAITPFSYSALCALASNLRSCPPSFASGCRGYSLYLRALNALFIWGELREKCAVARNFVSLEGIRVRDQGYECGRDSRSDSLAGYEAEF